MENKQLFEKQGNNYNPIFPLVRLEDIIDTISNKSIQWILNNYNHIYVEYSESVAITRNKVPSLLRRNGLWISYNTGKDIVTEWYKGKNVNINDYNQWTDDANWAKFEPLADGKVTYQHLSHALKQLMGKGNNITNFPDEEDITTDGTVLSFKDRDYEPANFSGLGRVILRKNIKVTDGQPKNILTKDMINKSNTIYEIRYDFDLNGEEITIPEGCVLDFQGGSLSNGIIKGNYTIINAEYNNILKNIELLGNWNILEFNVSWFGLIPNMPSIDCTPVVRMLIKLNIPIVFNAGNYYFSELLLHNNNTDKVAIIGEQNYGLNFKTIFNPYYDNQRYIIKVGGGKNCLGKDTNNNGTQRGYNIKIENIQFSGNLSKGMLENPLTNNYGGNVEYTSSLLILDRVEIGNFSISGKGLYTPFLTLGFIYECNFDNIIAYNNEGKSNTPTIQVVNDYNGGGLTAITVDRIMAEVNVGPLIKVSSASTISEMVINNVFYEHTIEWSNSVPDASVEYFGKNIPDVSQYKEVPVFDIGGYGEIIINNIFIGEADSIWYNSADHNNAPWDGVTRDCIKTFAHFTSDVAKSCSLIIKNIKCTGTPYLIVSGGVSGSYHKLIINNSSSELFITNKSRIAIDAPVNDIKSAIELVPNYIYKDIDLVNISKPHLIDYNVGYCNTPMYDNSNIFILSSIGNDRYALNENGFKFGSNIKYIIINGYSSFDGFNSVYVEYYNSNNEKLIINDKDYVTYSSYGDYGKGNNRSFYISTNIENAAYIKFYFNNYSFYIQDITASTSTNPIVPTMNRTTSIKNAIFINSNTNSKYVSNGNKFNLKNEIYCVESEGSSSKEYNILHIEVDYKRISGIATFGSYDNYLTLYISCNEDLYSKELTFYSKLLSKPTTVSGVSFFDTIKNKYIIEFTVNTTDSGALARYYNLYSNNNPATISMLTESTYNSSSCTQYKKIVTEGSLLEERPTSVSIGFQHFDNDLQKPIWWTGDKWVDATGANV